MPEGDTVFKLAERLRQATLGATVERSDFRVPQLATRDLTGRTIIGYETHGKHLIARFSDDVNLHSHLRMDGRWSITEPGTAYPDARMHHVRVVLRLDSGVTAWGIRLHDLRLVTTAGLGRVTGHLGPDPLRDDWDAAEAVSRIGARTDWPLVSALLDQTAIAGLGNFWVNELAFLEGVSPWTPVGDVDLPRLVERAAESLVRSATVPHAYQVTTGQTARGKRMWVYGRDRRPCLRCGGSVRMVDEKPNDAKRRRTWWCPTCQPGPVEPGRSRSARKPRAGH